jgi:Transglycosylase-like domain
MIRRLMLFASAAGALAVPGAAYADSLTKQTNHLRAEVVAKLGKRAPGRNIVRWGVLGHDGRTRPANHAELITYRDTLAQMLAPPPGPMGTPASASTVASSPETTFSVSSSSTREGASSGSLPACTWQPESGGDWSAVNSSSGAGGYYQILPSTWAAYGGTGSPESASPAEQTAIAQKIWASQGSSAWTNC